MQVQSIDPEARRMSLSLKAMKAEAEAADAAADEAEREDGPRRRPRSGWPQPAGEPEPPRRDRHRPRPVRQGGVTLASWRTPSATARTTIGAWASPILPAEAGCAMAEKLELTHPWLVAVWPGMGARRPERRGLPAGQAGDDRHRRVRGQRPLRRGPRRGQGRADPGRPSAAEPPVPLERPARPARPGRLPRRGPAAARQVPVLPAAHRLREGATGSSGCSRSRPWRPRCTRRTGRACSGPRPTRRPWRN